jgi:hypothetical protein
MSLRSDMKMDLKYESYIDLSLQHIAALRNLINDMMKSVGGSQLRQLSIVGR